MLASAAAALLLRQSRYETTQEDLRERAAGTLTFSHGIARKEVKKPFGFFRLFWLLFQLLGKVARRRKKKNVYFDNIQYF